jgi:hypothetical protein
MLLTVLADRVFEFVSARQRSYTAEIDRYLIEFDVLRCPAAVGGAARWASTPGGSGCAISSIGSP